MPTHTHTHTHTHTQTDTLQKWKTLKDLWTSTCWAAELINLHYYWLQWDSVFQSRHGRFPLVIWMVSFAASGLGRFAICVLSSLCHLWMAAPQENEGVLWTGEPVSLQRDKKGMSEHEGKPCAFWSGNLETVFTLLGSRPHKNACVMTGCRSWGMFLTIPIL